MSLYDKYSYDPSFCVFHLFLMDLLQKHLDANVSQNSGYLLVSKYLKLSIVDYSAPQSEEDKILYPLTDLIVDGTINQDKVDQIAYDQIVYPSHFPETKLDVLIDCMKRDYRKGLLPEELAPFFKWKFGEIHLEQISLEQVYAMKETVNEMIEAFEDKHPDAYDIHDYFIVDDPWQATRGFKEDKCMVAYLQYIDDNLVDLQVLISKKKRENLVYNEESHITTVEEV